MNIDIPHIEEKLSYDRIRVEVETLCTTGRGVEKFRTEEFSTDPGIVMLRQQLCSEMMEILRMESGFPGGEYEDISSLTGKLGIEGLFLDTGEMLILRRVLVKALELTTFINRTEDGKYLRLKEMTSGVINFPQVIERIDAILDKFGNVRDNASPVLSELRRTFRNTEAAVSKKLQQIIALSRSSGITDPEAAVSIRDGRSVIPVPAANKRKLKGFIHDESATGKTVYIEPEEVVELNNRLREIEYEQRREIVRILTEFTEDLRADVDGIVQCGEYVTDIDMIRAKARYGIMYRCVMPIMSDEGVLELRQARHPILETALKKEGKPIVPLDLKLTPAKHILVISGPNAGGKSVCLKTTGLLQLMYQSGMPVPVLENSQFPLFDSIFIDIGDQQSIDNDLSTYSSHLYNMKRMLQGARSRSLVLIDEFGSGTEPVIGGAIAEAILEKLVANGCYGVITTHYSNIKYFAGRSEGIVNGAMMFDVQNIMPLFRLEMGTPGSSFAVEIARKIGLPEDIIKHASELAGTDHIQIEKQLRDISRDRRYWEQKRDRIRIADRKVEDLENKYSEQLAAIKKLRADILADARAEAQKITSEANKKIENAIRTIRETQADKEKTRLVRAQVDKVMEDIDNVVDTASDERIDREMQRLVERQKRRAERKNDGSNHSGQAQMEEKIPAKPVKGSKVKIEGQAMIGEVLEIKGSRARVAFGQIITTVETAKLKTVSNSEYKKQARDLRGSTINISSDVTERKLKFTHNLDVRGMRAAEALESVQDFIDDAIMVGASRVSILHGKGTGALKEEIRKYLRAIDLVRSAEDEHVERGGAGITVVTLDT